MRLSQGERERQKKKKEIEWDLRGGGKNSRLKMTRKAPESCELRCTLASGFDTANACVPQHTSELLGTWATS